MARIAEVQFVARRLLRNFVFRVKVVADRFPAACVELGQEHTPKQRHRDHLAALEWLHGEFHFYLCPTLLDASGTMPDPDGPPPEWVALGQVSRRSEKALRSTIAQLNALARRAPDRRYRREYERCSKQLAPAAQEFSEAVLSLIGVLQPKQPSEEEGASDVGDAD